LGSDGLKSQFLVSHLTGKQKFHSLPHGGSSFVSFRDDRTARRCTRMIEAFRKDFARPQKDQPLPNEPVCFACREARWATSGGCWATSDGRFSTSRGCSASSRGCSATSDRRSATPSSSYATSNRCCSRSERGSGVRTCVCSTFNGVSATSDRRLTTSERVTAKCYPLPSRYLRGFTPQTSIFAASGARRRAKDPQTVSPSFSSAAAIFALANMSNVALGTRFGYGSARPSLAMTKKSSE
jgi:hypothetical protein